MTSSRPSSTETCPCLAIPSQRLSKQLFVVEVGPVKQRGAHGAVKRYMYKKQSHIETFSKGYGTVDFLTRLAS